ncbi:hypothetical protein Desti_0047 [Desulfomonile tiedjei DSM 6799]|uniref:Uncharacterized protein n=1 Tax=Desulfomonile tiedjei (strain ATCC 49306 / DSM 6799 / DCB-1) TaxID=706587 RepID=I4BZQ6_DESTA|nr:hypothetical protein Desti_0047 [Desulfomonile tiedjei DSM 6799]
MGIRAIAKTSFIPRSNTRYWWGSASLPDHFVDIIDHIEDVPARRPAPTNTPILNQSLIFATVYMKLLRSDFEKKLRSALPRADLSKLHPGRSRASAATRYSFGTQLLRAGRTSKMLVYLILEIALCEVHIIGAAKSWSLIQCRLCDV